MLKTVAKNFLRTLSFLLIFSQSIMAQDREPVLLTVLIDVLETEHGIRFSYVAEDVEGIRLTPPSDTLNLNEKIAYLNNQTAFHFSKINDRYYSISKKAPKVAAYCGTLLDAYSGMPLENATIQSENGYATVSNAEGVFTLPNSATSGNITVSYLGYETLILNYTELGANCPAIMILPAISQLKEVFISNVLVKGINRNFDGSTSINTNNFGLIPGQTENDVLTIAQALPGVESINETISTINIRGGTNDENLILWEGIRMYQLGHFFGLISAFNPNLTKEVTIYKNGTPAHYGQSVSGVIDMSSNNKVSHKFNGGIGANLINTQAFLEVPVSQNLSLQISGRTSINGLVETPVYTSFSNRVFQDTEITNLQNSEIASNLMLEEEFYFFDAGAKILWDITESDKLRVSFIAMENHFEYTEQLFDNREISRLEQKSEATGISWERQWNSSFSSQVSFQASHYLLDALNQDIFTTQEVNQENEVLDLSAKLGTHFQISEKWHWSNGYHFSEIGISNTQDVNLPRFRDYEKNVMRTHSAYSQVGFRSQNKKTRFQFGVRGNYFDKLKETTIEPRLYFYQEITEGLALEVLGESKSQSVTQRIDLQSDFLGIEKRRWVLADGEGIPLKKGQQVSLGLLYNHNGWFVNAEGYIKKVHQVTSKSQGFQNQFQFARTTGEYQVVGSELTINKKIKDLSLWASYAYAVNDYTFENLSPSQFPNNIDVRHTVNLASSYSISQFQLALGLDWRTGKPFTLPLPEASFDEEGGFYEIAYDLPNNQRLDQYVRLDFSAEYLWEISNSVAAKFNLALLNLTNNRNTLNLRYALEDPTSEASEIQQIEEISLGFTPNFSFQLLF